jgi:hypothetical protein
MSWTKAIFISIEAPLLFKEGARGVVIYFAARRVSSPLLNKER